MSTAAPDPFALPSDTDFRFALLVAAVLGVTLYVYNILFFGLAGGGMGGLGAYGRCDVAAVAAARRVAALTALRAAPDPFRVAVLRATAHERCIAPIQGATVAWMLGGVTGVVALASVRYWTWPTVKQRRDCLVPLTVEDAPEIVAALRTLSTAAGLQSVPAFLWNPLSAASGGVAFGRLGRPTVALGGGLVTQFYTDPAAFRAVVLHELAHLRNGDVDKTYFALSIWQAFVAAALVPYGLSLIGQPVDWAVSVTWRIVALAGLVYLSRNALLRTRELYADARAAAWDGPAGALGRVLAGLPARSGSSTRLQWLRVHPDSHERLAALRDPTRLARAGFLGAVATGIITTTAAPHLAALLTSAGLGGDPPVGPQVGAFLVYAPLAAGVLALAAWRSVHGSVRDGGTSRTTGLSGLVAPAVGLGWGFIAGRVLSFDAVVQSPATAGTAAVLAGGMLTVSVLAAVLGGTLALTWWLAITARVFLALFASGPPRSTRSTRLSFTASLVVASAVLASWLGVLSVTQGVGAVLVPRPTFVGAAEAAGTALIGAAGALATHPLTGLAAAGLIALPVIGWYFRPTSTG